jgi:hypothetical protein
MKAQFMAGVAASPASLGETDLKLIREAGIGWLRTGIKGFDQEKFLAGEKQPEAYCRMREKISDLRKSGFHFMGLTPTPHQMSAQAGAPGSPEYLANYRRICAFLASEFLGLIDYWQVANELDIWIFRGALTLGESVQFLKAGLRGIKETDRSLKVGVNITLFPSKPGEVDGNTDQHEGVFIAEGIYRDPDLDVDYAGFDSYPGTWREGGAESWHDYLDAFHDLVQKPIIIQEFGYSSAGEMMTEAEQKRGAYPCEVRKWRFAWKGSHTPLIQADFIAESYRIFAHKPYVLGATYYCWKDPASCWQCGSSDCPAETAWGLIDQKGNLKPSYHSLKSSLADLFRPEAASASV